MEGVSHFHENIVI